MQTQYYFAQAYGDDVYNTGSYNCSGTGCQTGQDSGGILAPNTGFFNSGPLVIIPTILVISILFAATILAIKKIIRNKKNKSL